jgi:glyoxylase-like metal-dependent hydrolase (beta-lactamase superfamily II)
MRSEPLRLLPLLALLGGPQAAGCATGKSASSAPTFRIEKLGAGLQMLQVTEDVWIHVSEDKTARWGNVSANGLLIRGGSESALVDTGWKVEQTQRIAAFAATTLHAPIRKVIITHSHQDRMGGISALAGQGVLVYAHELTIPSIAE